MTAVPGKKALLIDALKRTPAIQQEFIDSLSPEALNQPSSIEHWNVKDAINHLTFWQELQCDRIERLMRGEPKRDTSDTDTLNRENYFARRDISWEAARQQSQAALRDLLRLTESLTEEQCVANLLWRAIEENGYMHPILHIAEYYVEQGDVARGLTFYEKMVWAVDNEQDNEWHGTGVYNLGCFHARFGQAERALALFSEAFRLIPQLQDWAKEDPDLVALRKDARFQAILAG